MKDIHIPLTEGLLIRKRVPFIMDFIVANTDKQSLQAATVP